MIPIQNIYYMLSYSFSVLNEQGYKSIATEKFDNIAELMAAILVKGIATQLKTRITKRIHWKNRRAFIVKREDRCF